MCDLRSGPIIVVHLLRGQNPLFLSRGKCRLWTSSNLIQQYNYLGGRGIKHLDKTASLVNIDFGFGKHSYCCQWSIGAEASWYEGHDTLSLVQFPALSYNWLFWHFYHFLFQHHLIECLVILFLFIDNNLVLQLTFILLFHGLSHHFLISFLVFAVSVMTIFNELLLYEITV